MTELLVPDRFDGVQYRAADIEALDADEGPALLRAAPYDVEVRLDQELYESFAPATFSRSAQAPHRVKFYHGHSTNDGHLIGHAKSIEDRPDGVWTLFKFSNTLAGQEARELATDGTLDQCSIEFRPIREWVKAERKRDGLHIRHSRAHLLGVALVAHGAYSDKAFVASVRDHQAKERERIIARLTSYNH
jgi:HK97 family phage prohead protease